MRRLQKLATDCRCANFFSSSLNADFQELVDGPLPEVRIGPSASQTNRGGRTHCDKAPNQIEVSRDYCGRLKSSKQLSRILLHELGHWADCKEQRFPVGGPIDEGALAEIWCLGNTIDEKPVSQLLEKMINGLLQ